MQRNLFFFLLLLLCASSERQQQQQHKVARATNNNDGHHNHSKSNTHTQCSNASAAAAAAYFSFICKAKGTGQSAVPHTSGRPHRHAPLKVRTRRTIALKRTACKENRAHSYRLGWSLKSIATDNLFPGQHSRMRHLFWGCLGDGISLAQPAIGCSRRGERTSAAVVSINKVRTHRHKEHETHTSLLSLVGSLNEMRPACKGSQRWSSEHPIWMWMARLACIRLQMQLHRFVHQTRHSALSLSLYSSLCPQGPRSSVRAHSQKPTNKACNAIDWQKYIHSSIHCKVQWQWSVVLVATSDCDAAEWAPLSRGIAGKPSGQRTLKTCLI